MTSIRHAALALAILCLAGTPGAAQESDGFLYYEEGGAIVITNTPSRDDAKPLPGYEGTKLPDAKQLPATPYDTYIDYLARETGLSPGLIKAVAWVESGFDPRAVSPKGAVGLMQLMPATAARYGLDEKELRDPYENLRAGAFHLRDLLDEFGGDLTLALAAYNAGSGAVRRHGGVPAYLETRNYVRKVHRKLGKRTPELVRQEPAAATRAARKIEVRRREDGVVVFSN